MLSFKIGDVRVTRVEEQYGPTLPLNALLPSADLSQLEHLGDRREQFYEPASACVYASMHSWLVQTPQHTILVDTCNGNHKERAMEGFGGLDLPWLDTLAAAGAKPADVDLIVCTHLHLDHVGWNTTLQGSEWVPTFPNARALIHRNDLEFWNPTNPESVAIGINANVFEDSVQPLLDRDRAIVWEGDGYTVDDTLELALAAGHSPGMAIGLLESKGQRGVFAADSMHSPFQVFRPDWFCGFDLIPADAEATRRRILERCAETDAMLMPAHFAAPHAYKVRAEGDGFVAVDGV